MNNFQQLLEEEEKRMTKEASDRILHAIWTNADILLDTGTTVGTEPSPETSHSDQSVEKLPG